jgi:inner membrane protein
MDTLTHALSGALLARATAPSGANAASTDVLPLRRRMFVGALAAAFPDIDFVSSYLSPLSYLYHHRGVTHSVLLIPAWAFLIATMLALLWRMKPGWRAYIGIAAWGIAAHIAGDLITSFGTMVFAPLSDARFALSTTFIIDLFFTGIILLGLGATAVWRQSRAPAVAALVVLVSYVGGQWLLQQEALDFGRRHAASIGLRTAKVSAVPRPVWPLNWTVVIDDGQRYRYAHVNLLRKTVPRAADADANLIARLDAAYRPLDKAVWLNAGRFGTGRDDVAFAREAFSHADFRFFRWFAAYPALLKVESSGTERCAWFHDLRFVTPGRDATPFQYGMCRSERRWRPFQLIGGTARAAVY